MVMIAVVCIREMDMRMRHGFVPMPMRMPAAGRTEYVMSMLVVFLVPVFMGMLDGFVAVFVSFVLFVPFMGIVVARQRRRGGGEHRDHPQKQNRTDR